MSRKTSPVWANFTQITENSASCDYCKAIISCKGGPSNLNKHFRNKHVGESDLENAKRTKTTPNTTGSCSVASNSSASAAASSAISNSDIVRMFRTASSSGGTASSCVGTAASCVGTAASFFGTSASSDGISTSSDGISASSDGISVSNYGTSASSVGTAATGATIMAQPSAVVYLSDDNAASSSTNTVAGSAFASRQVGAKRVRQSNVSNFFRRPVTVMDKKILDSKILKMVVRHLLPFQLVEYEGFHELMEFLAPGYDMPSRTTLTRSSMPRKYADMVEAMKSSIVDVEAMSITTDIWTSRTTQGYMAVTGHYITKEWTMATVLLGCIGITGSHTAVMIGEELTKVSRGK